LTQASPVAADIDVHVADLAQVAVVVVEVLVELKRDGDRRREVHRRCDQLLVLRCSELASRKIAVDDGDGSDERSRDRSRAGVRGREGCRRAASKAAVDDGPTGRMPLANVSLSAGPPPETNAPVARTNDPPSHDP
jgi:hypothetical protein